MADHVNINEPSWDRRWEDRLRVMKLEAEVKNLSDERDSYRRDLEAIFTRIGRGDHAELHFTDGQCVRIIAEPPATEGSEAS